MTLRPLRLASSLALAALTGLGGCVSSSYSGVQYTPTSHVDVLHDDDAAGRSYITMGTVCTTAEPDMPLSVIQSELVSQARQRGADAIIIDRVQLDIIGYRIDSAGLPERIAPASYQGAAGIGDPIREKTVIARLIKYTR